MVKKKEIPDIEVLKSWLSSIKGPKQKTINENLNNICNIAIRYFKALYQLNPEMLERYWNGVPTKIKEHQHVVDSLEKEIAGIIEKGKRLISVFKNSSPALRQHFGEQEVITGNDVFSQWFWIPTAWKGQENESLSIENHIPCQRALEDLVAELEDRQFYLRLQKQSPYGSRATSREAICKQVLINSLMQLRVNGKPIPVKQARELGALCHGWAIGEKPLFGTRWGESATARTKKVRT